LENFLIPLIKFLVDRSGQQEPVFFLSPVALLVELRVRKKTRRSGHEDLRLIQIRLLCTFCTDHIIRRWSSQVQPNFHVGSRLARRLITANSWSQFQKRCQRFHPPIILLHPTKFRPALVFGLPPGR